MCKRVPANDNYYSDRTSSLRLSAIRTLKENLLWVRALKTIEELRAELVAFARRYNETWLVSRHGSREGQRGATHATNCN